MKAAKIDALQPDLLVGLGEDADLEAILVEHASIRTLRLPASPEAKRKTDGERRSARREAFRSYFAEGFTRTLDRSDLEPTPSHLGCHAGLLVGLADASGADLGLGIVLECPTPTTIEMFTPVRAPEVRDLILGSLILDRTFNQTPVKRILSVP